jgi:hypothetical protein
VLLLDIFDQNIVSVFDCMLRSDAFELPWYESPSAAVIFYHAEKLNIFLSWPLCLLDVRVDVAYPFFSAHGEGFEVTAIWSMEKAIWNSFPFRFVFFVTNLKLGYSMMLLSSYIYYSSHSLDILVRLCKISWMWYSTNKVLFFLKIHWILATSSSV